MKKWKRVLSVILMAAMLVGLTACGGKNGNGGETSGGKNSNVNSELAKQYVYRMEEFDISGVQSEGDNYVQGIMESGGRLYMVLQNYNYSKNMNNVGYQMLSMNMDGSDIKVYELQSAPEGEESHSHPAQESTDGTDGGEAGQSSAAPEAAEDLAAVDGIVDRIYPNDAYESTSFGNFQMNGDRILGIKNYYYEDYSDSENYVSIRENYVCAWDLEGKMLWQSTLNLPQDEDSWYYVNAFIGLGDGKAVVLIGGNETCRMTVDKDGNVSEMQRFEELDKYMEYSGSSAVLPDGRYLLTYYGENWQDMFVVTYDFKNNSAGSSFPIPASVANKMGTLNVDSNGDLFYTNNIGVFKYHIGDEDGVQMMSFVNSDMDISSLSAIYPMDDDHFVGMYSVYDDQYANSTIKGGLFTRVAPEDIPDKQVLVLGGNYIGSDIKKRVIEYNKSSDTYRIVLRDYSQYVTDDYMAGYTQMNNDIISGNMPDILVVDSFGEVPLENYISKGLLADIGELMAKDEEIAGTEYMENVFEACRVDGKLYEIIPSFSVSTYVAKKSLVGDITGWTMEDALQYVASMPEGASLFGDMTRSDFFNVVLSMRGSDFIDVSTGKCNFDSEEFISLMEFAKGLPEELGDDYYVDGWYTAYESQYRENRTLLASCHISGTENLVYTINGSFGEDVSYVGFPNEGGQGSVISTNTSYVLAAGSSHLDEAWNFMRYYLTDEYQKTVQWPLPVNKKYFDEVALKGTKKPSYTDEYGKEVESDYTWWINDESIVLDPLTEAQVEEVKSFVSSVTGRAYYNQDVQNIISEEMEAFYQGQKSAKDVASIIQSRAQIFVNENR